MNFGFNTRKLLSLHWLRRARRRHLRFGTAGERKAAAYLRQLGHRVLARNYTCPYGEIDLVTFNDGQYVFVEVKTRTSDTHQDPIEAVGPAKQHRLRRAARHYLSHASASDHASRFDVVTVIWPTHGKPSFEHIENAF